MGFVVFLAGQDWRTRALLRAQLLEEGIAVEADATIEESVARLEASTVLPRLLVADVTTSDDPAVDVERLKPWAKRLPIWLIASRALNPVAGLEQHGFEAVLLLPVDLGELVGQIKQWVR